MIVEYVDPMDNSLPPQIYIREWKKCRSYSYGMVQKYFLILMDIGTIEYDRK